MSKKYIIDGYNLGFKIPTISHWISKGETDKAIKLILNFINSHPALRSAQVTVVFDGKHGVHQTPHSYHGVQVKFSKKPETADDIIRNFLRKAEDIRSWTVVTSDNEIEYTAKDLGAQTIKSEVFKNQAQSHSPDKILKENEQKYNPGEVDIDYWLEQFGTDKKE